MRLPAFWSLAHAPIWIHLICVCVVNILYEHMLNVRKTQCAGHANENHQNMSNLFEHSLSCFETCLKCFCFNVSTVLIFFNCFDNCLNFFKHWLNCFEHWLKHVKAIWFTLSRSFQYIFQCVSNQSIEAIVADRDARAEDVPFWPRCRCSGSSYGFESIRWWHTVAMV